MEKSNYKLILIQEDGAFATPDVEITADFETSFSIQSAADISLRKDKLSKNLNLPGTKNNNRIFNNLFSFNRDSDDSLTDTLFYNYSPNIGVRAVLYENNYPIIVGILKLNEVLRDANGSFNFTGVITGKMVSFFGKISDLFLTDLDGFDEVLTYSWVNILNSWVFTTAQKFFYPQIDFGFGKGITPTKFDYRNFRPAIYARQYIKSILASQGYKYKSNFIDSDLFNRAFIPFQEMGFGRTVYGNFVTVKGGFRVNPLNRPRYGVSSSFASTVYGAFEDNDIVEIIRNTPIQQQRLGAIDYTTNGDVFRFKVAADTALSFKINFHLESRRANGFGVVEIVRIVGGKFDPDSPLASVRYEFSDNTIINQEITLNVDFRHFDPGFTFALVCSVVSNDTVDFNQNSIDANFGNPDASVGTFTEFALGDTFSLKDCLPKEQKASDFLKSLFQFFNFYAIENPENDREIIIEPYDVFYNQTKTPQLYALDWTKKIDQKSLHMKINTNLPKKYNFKFKEDSDYYNTLYKNTYNATYGNLTITNKNGSADEKTVEVVFSPTIVVREDGDSRTFPAIYTGEITDKKPYKSNLRILYNNDTEACDTYNIVLTATDGTTTNIVAGVSIYQKSHNVLNLTGQDVFNLLFGIPLAVYYPVQSSIFNLPTLYTLLYKNQIQELNDENIFTLEVTGRLSEVDISNLDLRTPIFIQTVQGHSYFKIMEVNYFSSQELSRITFQKIII